MNLPSILAFEKLMKEDCLCFAIISLNWRPRALWIVAEKFSTSLKGGGGILTVRISLVAFVFISFEGYPTVKTNDMRTPTLTRPSLNRFTIHFH